MDAKREPGVRIDQVFLIGARFSHRPDFLSLPARGEVPAQEVSVSFKILGSPGAKRAGVAVKVETNPEDKSAYYQFSVEVGALVSAIEGEENLPPLDYVKQAGGSFIFPFVREAVANLTARGRFGPVYLKPFNVRLATENKSDVKGSKRVAKGVAKSRNQP